MVRPYLRPNRRSSVGGVLGIVNALTVSITDRRRELGVLQAVRSAPPADSQHGVAGGGAIGLIGLALGLVLGAAAVYYSLEVTRRDLIGMDMVIPILIRWPWRWLPVILGAAFLAALGPAERAVRGSLVEALEYE